MGNLQTLDFQNTTWNDATSASIKLDNWTTIVPYKGTYVFYKCSKLENVVLPNWFHLGEKVLEKCSSLINVNFPDGITEIGNGAFF